ncbi:hypothetical protein [Undibacterium sp. TJN19]|uniref:hypothetical protein n=1 Tax=Undibacterium sp. TJN19 TaxID=3413055 RepID=UPI003BF071FE
MAHNTNRILSIIKANPGIRQVEIADKVDCDMDAVEWALKPQIELGDVLRSLVAGPNGVSQSSYKLAPNFEAPDYVEPKTPAAPTVEQQSKDTPSPAQAAPYKSKPDLAIDHLSKVGFADDVAMRVAMGLNIGGNVKAYLATALEKRLVIRVKKEGVLGYAIGNGVPVKLSEKKQVINEPKAVSIPVFSKPTMPAKSTESKIATSSANIDHSPVEISPNKYQRQVKGTLVDVYDVLKAWDVRNPAIQHAIKKLLQPGQRGHKDAIQDLREAGQSIERAIELEDNEL